MHEAKKAVSRMVDEVPIPEPPETKPAEKETASGFEGWAKVREIAMHRLERFISLEPKVLRGDDPEAIHDIRVASRRLQQALDLLYPNVQDKEVRRLRRRLRLSRRALGEVRNCDVLVELVNRALNRKRGGHREAWSTLKNYLLERRENSFGKATRKLTKANLGGLYVRLKELFSSMGDNQHSASSAVIAFPERSTTETVGTRIAQSLGRVWEPFEKQVNASRHDSSAATLHGARIAAKRLRYLMEVVQENQVEGSVQAVSWLKRFQQHLGDWHDLEVLEQMMVEMVARPSFLSQNLELAMQVERLVLRIRARKKGFVQKYFEMTQDTDEWRLLKHWVTHLIASPSEVFARG